MGWVYRCVAAPRRVKRNRGQKSPAEAFSAAFEAVIAEQAAAGWDYLRTDLAPMETKSGLFGRAVETHQAVMVFRRPAPGQAAAAAPGVAEIAAAPLRREPEVPRLGAARID